MNSDIRFRHFPQNRMSIGYRVKPIREQGPGLRVEVAVAMASPRDNFSRRLGRKVAIDRLNSRKDDIPHRHYMFFNEAPMPESGQQWAELEDRILEELPEHEDFGHARCCPRDWNEHVQTIME